MRNISIIAVALAGSILATSAFAKLNSTDRKLMAKLAQGGSSEVELAKIVRPKADNARVIDFAQRMINEHAKSFQALDRIATADKAPLKSGMDSEHKKFAAQLAHEKHGLAYDRTYIDQMVKDHKKDSADVKKALKKIENPALKSWTENELRIVEGHLKLAKEISAKLK